MYIQQESKHKENHHLAVAIICLIAISAFLTQQQNVSSFDSTSLFNEPEEEDLKFEKQNEYSFQPDIAVQNWLDDESMFSNKGFLQKQKKIKTDSFEFDFYREENQEIKENCMELRSTFTDDNEGYLLTSYINVQFTLKQIIISISINNQNTPFRFEEKKVQPQVIKKIKADAQNLQNQIVYLEKIQLENMLLFQQELIQETINEAKQLQKNKWKQSTINLKLYLIEFHSKTVKKEIQQQKTTPKLAISKYEEWDVHLKSLRTHFLQKIFNDFNNKMWKVPNQQVLKNYIFSGNLKNKVEMSKYLQNEKQNVEKLYQFFPMKRDFYIKMIDLFISTIELSYLLEGKVDELLFELLFKAYIPRMFES